MHREKKSFEKSVPRKDTRALPCRPPACRHTVCESMYKGEKRTKKSMREKKRHKGPVTLACSLPPSHMQKACTEQRVEKDMHRGEN
eukprot:1043324-Pelagomonas_calceolata.AAC.1